MSLTLNRNGIDMKTKPNIYKTVSDRVRAKFKPFVAKHPETGKWHGICKVLRSPNTIGFKRKKDAIEAWYSYEATAICDISTRQNQLNDI